VLGVDGREWHEAQRIIGARGNATGRHRHVPTAVQASAVDGATRRKVRVGRWPGLGR
jgi:hypothetical protein